jgi:hypothetical protein
MAKTEGGRAMKIEIDLSTYENGVVLLAGIGLFALCYAGFKLIVHTLIVLGGLG